LIALHVAVISVMAWWLLRHEGERAEPIQPQAQTPEPVVDPIPEPEPVAIEPAAKPESLPSIGEQVIEVDGTYRGKPFWAKLRMADGQFENNRMLELVYTPPPPADLDNTVVTDCPFVLLDKHLRVIAWNGRHGLSKVIRIDTGYKVQRELLQIGEGEDEALTRTMTMTVGPAWDLHIAPILLAMCWRADASAKVPVVDLFGAQVKKLTYAAWSPGKVEIAGETLQATADADGRLIKLVDSKGYTVLTIRQKEQREQKER
jgi:hypothetical protein